MDEIVNCPYNLAHAMKRSRLQIHLRKCRQNTPDSFRWKICDFNASHHILIDDMKKHLKVCREKQIFDNQCLLELAANTNVSPIKTEKQMKEEAIAMRKLELDGWGDEDEGVLPPRKDDAPQEEQQQENFLEVWSREVDELENAQGGEGGNADTAGARADAGPGQSHHTHKDAVPDNNSDQEEDSELDDDDEGNTETEDGNTSDSDTDVSSVASHCVTGADMYRRICRDHNINEEEVLNEI